MVDFNHQRHINVADVTIAAMALCHRSDKCHSRIAIFANKAVGMIARFVKPLVVVRGVYSDTTLLPRYIYVRVVPWWIVVGLAATPEAKQHQRVDLFLIINRCVPKMTKCLYSSPRSPVERLPAPRQHGVARRPQIDSVIRPRVAHWQRTLYNKPTIKRRCNKTWLRSLSPPLPSPSLARTLHWRHKRHNGRYFWCRHFVRNCRHIGYILSRIATSESDLLLHTE